MAIWNGERRQMAAADFRLCGHASSGPSGVFDQSNARTTVAISDEPSQAVLSPNPAEARLLVCATKSVTFYEECRDSRDVGSHPSPTAIVAQPRSVQAKYRTGAYVLVVAGRTPRSAR